MSFLSRVKKEKQQQTPAKNWVQSLFRDLDVIYIFVAIILLNVLLFRVTVVNGGSMNQTLVDGDKLLLISNTVYRNPKQGDIIVASKDSFRDGECIVKRIIATEGQLVEIDFENRVIKVDGQVLEESYAYFAANDRDPLHFEGVTFPQVVPEGCVFVMGDNRNHSTDSRSTLIGLVDERSVLGKVIARLSPTEKFGPVS